MNENGSTSKSIQDWLTSLFNKKPESDNISRNELIDTIRQTRESSLLSDDAIGMIEGVLNVDTLIAEDIMIPRSQISFIHRDWSYREILDATLTAGHSRYPVIDENRDDIDGILHAKDLLKYSGRENEFDIDDILRRPIFATENTRTNELLTLFKKSRNHMAVILDEYAGICGIVTIEDVLEQIVGEIDDEHDHTDDVPNIRKINSHFTVKATTPIDEFNRYFESSIYTEQFDTIGGFISHEIGKIPKQGDKITINGFTFHITNSDGRRVHSMQVSYSKSTAQLEQQVA